MRVGESSDSATDNLKLNPDAQFAKQKIFDKIKAISSQSGRNKMFQYEQDHEIIDPRQTLSSQKKLDFSALSRTDLSKDTNEGQEHNSITGRSQFSDRASQISMADFEKYVSKMDHL